MPEPGGPASSRPVTQEGFSGCSALVSGGLGWAGHVLLAPCSTGLTTTWSYRSWHQAPGEAQSPPEFPRVFGPALHILLAFIQASISLWPCRASSCCPLDHIWPHWNLFSTKEPK